MIIIITITAVISASLGYFALTRLQSKKREFFLLYIICIFITSVGYLLELTATTANGGLIAVKVMYIGSVLFCPFFLIFVQKYTEKEFPKIINGIIVAIGIIFILLVWTSDFHTLYYTHYWYDDVSAVNHLGIERGILYPFGIFYPVVCNAISFVLLLKRIFTTSREKRKNYMLCIFCAVSPFATHVLYIFDIDLYGGYASMIIITISLILLYFGIVKNDLLENEETIRSQNWLKDMIGNISHDLKTPLTVMGQYLELLDDNTITLKDTERADYIHIVYNKNLNLQRLIRNLFEITRIESGQLVYNIENYPVSELAFELEHKFAKFLETCGLSFSVSYNRLCQIKLDKDKIWSVLNNIIYNAVRHTSRGGAICVTADFLETPGGSGKCAITITDTGEGIDDKHLPYIFDRFYKVSQARNKGESGIGLYIVKTIVQNIGGEITVKSELNKGTAFTISLSAVCSTAVSSAAVYSEISTEKGIS
jgi:signal transduction histidine kinase